MFADLFNFNQLINYSEQFEFKKNENIIFKMKQKKIFYLMITE